MKRKGNKIYEKIFSFSLQNDGDERIENLFKTPDRVL